MHAVTVYCSASTTLDPDFHHPAVALGTEIARRGLDLIYGGGCVGLMGEVSQAARAAGGRTIGIITRTLMDREVGDSRCDELIVVDTMRERKRLLCERGDAFIILPGGIGTYEEFFEILVGRHLGEHGKPIGVINAHGYFNPMVAMIEHGVEHRFIPPSIRDLVHIHPEPVPVLEQVLNHCASG